MAFDADTFRTLVETHQRMVYSIALRVCGETGAAEEVAQDVFLELHRSAEKITGADHLRNWLRRVAVHRATDALRKRSRQPEMAAEPWQDGLSEPDATAGAGGGGGGFGVGLVVEARLEELLSSLPEAMRVAVVLRYQEDMLPDEIAQLLRQPVASVKSNLQRGLKLLRRKAAVTMKEYER